VTFCPYHCIELKFFFTIHGILSGASAHPAFSDRNLVKTILPMQFNQFQAIEMLQNAFVEIVFICCMY